MKIFFQPYGIIESKEETGFGIYKMLLNAIFAENFINLLLLGRAEPQFVPQVSVIRTLSENTSKFLPDIFHGGIRKFPQYSTQTAGMNLRFTGKQPAALRKILSPEHAGIEQRK